jgi:hypothetical protein
MSGGSHAGGRPLMHPNRGGWLHSRAGWASRIRPMRTGSRVANRSPRNRGAGNPAAQGALDLERATIPPATTSAFARAMGQSGIRFCAGPAYRICMLRIMRGQTSLRTRCCPIRRALGAGLALRHAGRGFHRVRPLGGRSRTGRSTGVGRTHAGSALARTVGAAGCRATSACSTVATAAASALRERCTYERK